MWFVILVPRVEGRDLERARFAASIFLCLLEVAPSRTKLVRHPSNVGSKIQCRDMNLKQEYRFVKGDRPRPSALFGGENIPTSVLKKRSERLLGFVRACF